MNCVCGGSHPAMRWGEQNAAKGERDSESCSPQLDILRFTANLKTVPRDSVTQPNTNSGSRAPREVEPTENAREQHVRFVGIVRKITEPTSALVPVSGLLSLCGLRRHVCGLRRHVCGLRRHVCGLRRHGQGRRSRTCRARGLYAGSAIRHSGASRAICAAVVATAARAYDAWRQPCCRDDGSPWRMERPVRGLCPGHRRDAILPRPPAVVHSVFCPKCEVRGHAEPKLLRPPL